MERRAELEHPLGLVGPPSQQPPPAISTAALLAGPADFVLEVGTEELPPDDVVSACQQLRCEGHMSKQRAQQQSVQRVVCVPCMPPIQMRITPKQPRVNIALAGNEFLAYWTVCGSHMAA